MNSEIITRKLFTLEGIEPCLNRWRFKNERIVFTNGCFDLLHQGHIDYLAKAADLGNKLVIGLNTDASVRKLKGDARPIQDERSRAIILSALFFVDAVVLFDQDTPLELIQKIQPNVLVKGADYNIENIVGAQEVLARGGAVQTIEFLAGYSTSAIEKRIKGQ